MALRLFQNLPGLTGRLTRRFAAPGAAPVCPAWSSATAIVQPQPERTVGRIGGRPSRRPEITERFRGFGRAFWLSLLALCLLATGATNARAATSPGTLISNTAAISFEIGGVPQPVTPSAPAVIMTRSPAVIEFLKYAPPGTPGLENVPVAPTDYQSGALFLPVAQPPEAVAQPVPLVPATLYHAGEPLFVRLTDYDQNLDPTVAETVLATIGCIETGDTEILRLTETGPNTGVFTGYLPTSLAGSAGSNGVLLITIDSHLTANYTDIADGTVAPPKIALVDPLGIVFDSRTGDPVEGATVTLLDAVTYNDASVFADDGVTPYPATLVTGADGAFRFPFVNPGSYRLRVTPPAGYTAPSTVADAVLQTRPGAPFALNPGSRGESEVIVVSPGPALHIDVPVDPIDTGLWLEKQVSREQASIGDFLRYHLILENKNAVATATQTVIDDRLPLGFRYQKGSTRLDGTAVGDPVIGSDGRQLTFTVGDLLPGTRREVTYVVEVAAGAKPGEAVNRAQAADNTGARSNIARRTVTVREEFFRDTTFLLGRVLTGGCAQNDQELDGLAGVRIYLEDGRFTVTDTKGRYHFAAVEPGVHVVQVDTTSLPTGYEMLPCEQTSQFAGRAFSQFVDLKGGTLWQVNFYATPIPPPTGEVSLHFTAALDGRIATFRVNLAARTVPAGNLRLTVMLPAGAGYLKGSAQRDRQPLDDPASPGEAVTFRLAELGAGQQTELTFQATFDEGRDAGELPAKAVLLFDTPAAKGQRTPVAEARFKVAIDEQSHSEEQQLYPRFPVFVADLQDTDRAMLEQLAASLQGRKIVRLDVVGHTDNQEIAPRSRHIFADNQALSEARARSVATFLKERLALSEEVMTVRGMGDSLPVAGNDTAEGRALNRRVDLNLVAEKVSLTRSVELIDPGGPAQSVATAGKSPAEVAEKAAQPAEPVLPEAPEITQGWLAAAKPEARLIWPEAGFVPLSPSTTISVQHLPSQKVAITLNGQPVPPLNFDGTTARKDGQVAVSTWKGVDLAKGHNLIETVVSRNDGQVVVHERREIWYVDEPYRAELLSDRSVLAADGINAPVLAVRLVDRDGHPVRPGLYIEASVAAPYRVAVESERKIDATTDRGGGRPRFVTGTGGVALITLEPTTMAGEVLLELPFRERTESLRTWLKSKPREWILVGFAEGTAGYNTLTGNMVNTRDAGIDENGYTDGRVKFFAKGAVKGEWLLTMAYDSDKPRLDGDSLHQMISPESYYPLYGDETQQGEEAASARKIYVKLERGQFYALFGDMQTGLTHTVLSQYSRSMNGFKAEQQGETFSYTVFAADTRQAFARDELRGDGTSGRYRLSEKNLVINSEEVVIETRDRFHNERVIKEERMARYTDYDIDFDAGTLFFKRPVPSKDLDLNPVFIVVRYETRDSSGTNLNYGGRGAVKMLDGKVETGATLVHEQKGMTKGDLYGADITVKVTPQTTLRAELATTDVKETTTDRTGDAYLAEIEHRGEKLDGRAWFRQQDPAFGLGQQGAASTGMRTYGAEGAYKLAPRWKLTGEAWHEDNLGSDAKRDVGTMATEYQTDRYGLHSGLREARDRFTDGTRQTSRQLLFGGDWITEDRKLTLRANHEQSLGNSNDNVDFPTRTTFGADYRINDRVSLFAEQEFTWGDAADTQGTRAGVKANLWQGGEVRTSLERQSGENGERIFGLFGVGQTWQVNKEWSIDLSVDRSQTIRNKPAGQQVNDNAAPASGSDDDFTAVSVGAARRTEKWSWWNRLEVRQADSEDRVGISTGIVGEVREGIAVSGRLMAFVSDSAGRKSDEEEITLGLAYRPERSKWIILERLDLSLANSDDVGDSSDSMRIVNHLHANFRASRQWQSSFYYGLKYVRENFDGKRYAGYTDMLAIETRYNINPKWDVGVHGALLHSWNSNQFDYSLGGDVGYLLMTNAWVSAGYNLAGFEDDDFSAASYTAQGPYVHLRMKFDQQSVKDAAAWLSK